MVTLEYGRDVDRAVTLLGQARDFSEAVRVVSGRIMLVLLCVMSTLR